jgi:hypothetical protein
MLPLSAIGYIARLLYPNLYIPNILLLMAIWGLFYWLVSPKVFLLWLGFLGHFGFRY